MNSFIYDIPVKIYFGRDQLCHLGEELGKFGRRILMVYGGSSIRRTGLYDAVTAKIKAAGLELFELSGIAPNPHIDSVRQGAALCRENGIDAVLAVGGGSVIDAAKFIAAGACSDTDPWKFFSEWAPIDGALPVITVLTLAATGSEMDSCGVISNPDTRDKLIRLSPHVLPKVSFLDPSATFTVGTYQTACGSADILSHIFEVYFNTEKGLYMLDTFMEGMMKTVLKFAPVAMKNPDDYEARANLMWASSWAMNGFITGGRFCDWSCHPVEHELSALYNITHGLGLAIITPRWLEYCLNENTLPKYVQFGVNVFGIDSTLPPMDIARVSIDRLSDFLFGTLGLDSTLTAIGIDGSEFDTVARKACPNGAINGFVTLKPDDVKNILAMCL